MNSGINRPLPFWIFQTFGWLLLIFLIYSQGISAFNYELGVSMGTQESVESITEIGTAFWKGFALADLVFYIPLLAVGLLGHIRNSPRGRICLAASLGITIYWPIVCLVALVHTREAADWKVISETPYWIACLIIMLWGIWGLFLLFKKPGLP